jgi:hypothetical protein
MFLIPTGRPLASRALGTFTVLLAALLLLTFPSRSAAQVTTATVSGTVEDATGALVPGATVTLKNTKNNFVRKTVANGSAVFSFPSVDSGDYVLTVSMAGFNTFVEKGIHLDPQDSRTLTDIKLKPGDIAQTVTVQAPESTQDTGERSSIITSEDINRLSTVGRDVTELLKILPGSAIATSQANLGGGGGASNTTADQTQTSIGGSSGSYAMNGSPLNGVSVRSDGANLDDPASYSGTTQNINMDMVAEVKVSQSNFGADTANGPIVIDAVGKSGGAQYHGSIYTYGRVYKLNSQDALAAPLGQTKPSDHQVYPGFNVGGPVRIPHWDFNHNNKLTFFGGIEDLAQRNVYAYQNASSALIHALVPTAGMRQGDFSPGQIMAYLGPVVSCAAGGNGGNPTCGYTTGNSQYSNIVSVPMTASNGDQVTNGNIAAYLDPGAVALLNLLPLPNRTNLGDGFNYSHSNLINNDLVQGRIRFDLAATDNDKFYVVYNSEQGKYGAPQAPYYSPTGESGGANTPGGGLIAEQNSQSGSFNWTRVISKSLTNEFFASIAYLETNFVPQKASALQADGIGYPYKSAYANATTQYPQLSDYGLNGLPVALYQDFSQLPRGQYDKRFTPGIGDNLTKIWGKHSIKVGLNIERATNNQVLPNTSTNGAVSNYYTPAVTKVSSGQTGAISTYYSTCYVAMAGSCTGTNQDNELASFAEGLIDQYSQTNYDPPLDTYWWNVSLYYSDDWKIRPNVTLTYGLRMEHLGAWNDAHGIGAAVWNPATVNDTPSAPGAAPNVDTLPGFLWHQIDHSIPTSGIHSRFAFFEPRVGFSWDIQGNGKTTLRGGYGQYRYHDNWNDISYTMAAAYGVRQLTLPVTQSLEDTANGETLAAVGTENLPQNEGTFLGSVGGLDPKDNEEPMTATYSATVARQLPFNSSLEVAYVGNNSKYILNDGNSTGISLDNVNAIPLGGFYQPPPDNRPNPCTFLYPAPPAGSPANLPCTPAQVQDFNQTQIQLFRPYENYQDIQVLSHKLYSNYNGLQTTYNKQRGKATYQINYTFSKVLGVRGGYNNGVPADAFNYRHDYTALSYDRSDVFNASYSYNFGTIYHGRKALQEVLNWWLISGITSIQSGPNLQAASYNSNFGLQGNIKPAGSPESVPVNSNVFLGTPDVQVQPLLICDPRKNLQKNQFINGNCFQLPQPSEQLNSDGTTYSYHYTNGPFEYPYVHGPAYFNSDLTVAKDFHLTERQSMQFRFAAFNFLNHPLTTFVGSFPEEFQLVFNDLHDSNPSAAVPQQNFGVAPYKVGHRTVEMALKYFF